MIKRFCDICGNELTEENMTLGANGRLHSIIERQPGTTLKVEVLTGLNGTIGAGDFCKYCVIDAVNRADDRPSSIDSNTNRIGIIEVSDEQIDAIFGSSPFVARRKIDKIGYEVLQQTNQDWRVVIGTDGDFVHHGDFDSQEAADKAMRRLHVRWVLSGV